MVGEPARPIGSRWRRHTRSLRVRTTAVAVVVVGIALVIGGATLVVLLRNSLTTQVRTTAELRAVDVAGLLESGTPPDRLAVKDEESLIIQVLDGSNTVVASSENIAGEGALADLQPGRSTVISSTPVGDDHSFLLVSVAARAPSGRYRVLVGRSTAVVTESTNLVVALLTGGLPLLLVLVGWTTWRVVGRTLAPVEAIRREVDEISALELHRRVPESSSDDEIARLAGTMNRMLDRLEASHQQQHQFVSDASHELRSPVASIRQNAEVAIAHPGQTSVEELADVVLAEGLRIERLVEDLLLLARADERTLGLNRRPVDLDDLVFDEAARLRSMTTLRIDVSGVSAGRIDGDRAHLARALRNLGDNAARHARSAVRFTLHERGDWVHLSVDDDGDGVGAGDRTAIFDRFVRLDEARARDHGGSGLGLAIVAEIVSSHGGSVEVRDGSLGGAQFEIVLPASPDC